MARVFYVVSILCLIGASLLFGLCGVQWRQGVPLDERDSSIPLGERLRARQGFTDNNNADSNPLLAEAEALALYLSPPKPPASPAPTGSSQSAVSPPPAPRPPNPTPQFRILAISYYRSNPDRSLAMVWDANKGGYWIKKGDRLGHFVIERIEKEAIFYRDGEQLRQMAVALKQTPPLARLKSKESASVQELAAHQRLVSASPQ